MRINSIKSLSANHITQDDTKRDTVQRESTAECHMKQRPSPYMCVAAPVACGTAASSADEYRFSSRDSMHQWHPRPRNSSGNKPGACRVCFPCEGRTSVASTMSAFLQGHGQDNHGTYDFERLNIMRLLTLTPALQNS